MHPVCGGNRVEQAVMITKNAAQANDSGVGVGPNVHRIVKGGVGPTPAFHNVKPSKRFSGLRNPVYGANGTHRQP
jgi:hypothetical protein